MSKQHRESGTADCGELSDHIGDRPDLVAWRHRHELRRSSAAQQHRSVKQYTRKQKHRDASCASG
jgi:hypothetical protein